MASNTTLVASFGSNEQARQAVDALRQAGFTETHIGLVSWDETRLTGAGDPGHSHWKEGTEIGAAAGAVTGVGLGIGVLSGLLPPLGPVIAGGTLVALLASAGGGAVTGGVIGALVGLGVPEDEATYYQEQLHSGRPLVTVDTSGGRYAEAVDILQQFGGHLRRPAMVGRP